MSVNKINNKETNSNNKKVKVKFPEVQSEGLLQINKQVNKTESRPYGFYSKKTNEELVNECIKYCQDNRITKRTELQMKNKGLYNILRKRNLLDSFFPPLKSKHYGFYSNMSNEELIEYGKDFCKKNKITKRRKLQKYDGSLYDALRKSELLDSIFGSIERKPVGFYYKMSDGELIEYGKKYCKDNNITKRTKLFENDAGLYVVLRVSELLDSIFAPLKSKPRGFYPNMSDEELVKYASDFLKNNNITKKYELEKKNASLYIVLRKRKLLDSIFPEQSHLGDLVDAIRNFGDGENE